MSAPQNARLDVVLANMQRQAAELDRKAGMSVKGEPGAALLYVQFAEMMRENLRALEAAGGGA